MTITAAHLRAARAALGWTQPRAAAAAAVTQSAIWRSETTGPAKMRPDNVARIVAAYEAAGVKFSRASVAWGRVRKRVTPASQPSAAPAD